MRIGVGTSVCGTKFRVGAAVRISGGMMLAEFTSYTPDSSKIMYFRLWALLCNCVSVVVILFSVIFVSFFVKGAVKM